MSEKETILLVAKDIYLANLGHLGTLRTDTDSVVVQIDKAFGGVVDAVTRAYFKIAPPGGQGRSQPED